MKTFRLLLTLLFVASLAPAHASVVYFSNLDQATVDTADLDTSSNLTLAQSFLTDSSAASFQLDQVVLRMSAATNGGGNFQVSILVDSGSNVPGGLLAMLTGSSDPAAVGDYTYTANAVMLAPNTLYWMDARVTSGAAIYNWDFTSSNTTTGSWLTQGWAEINSTTNPNWTPIRNTAPQIMSISATPATVPEPAITAMFAGLAAIGLAYARRRQRINCR